MSKEITLEAMVRRASRMAEEMFEKIGAVEMFWLLDSKLLGQTTLVTPMQYPEGVEEGAFKEMAAARLRTEFKEKAVTRYAVATEAWKAPGPRPSSELPDDEGTVFITCVPGSAFQVLGV
jgi:hypothetical protein